MMDFNKYQEQAWGFALESAKNPGYLFTGLAGEAGEVCSLAAKQWRDDSKTKEEFMNALGKEIGDVLWFCAGLATMYGLSMENLAKGNIEKLNSRQQRNVIQGSGDER
jgi:NTP pyrophosphatase (non-canonical NTP hydrolase)